MLERLRNRARDTSHSSLLVLLDPNPVMFLHGAEHWPTYDDPTVSVRLILAAGIDGVLRVRFRKQDLEAGAADLLAVVFEHVRIAELWLGATQTLGRGDRGSEEGVSNLVEQHHIRLVRMSGSAPGLGWDLRRLLASGCLHPVIEFVGRPPLWSRPRSGRVRLNWCAGVYKTVAVEDPTSRCEGCPVDIRLEPEGDGGSSFRWPDLRVKYLAFVAGPNDSTDATRSGLLG
jgi:hypothetical protein